jgi:hypothetical protein
VPWPYEHRATLTLPPGGDPAAPGAAVTVALCGHWEHQPPCRWPHHTAAEPAGGGRFTVRTGFSCAPDQEREVRARIVTALAGGRLVGPNGETSWVLETNGS